MLAGPRSRATKSPKGAREFHSVGPCIAVFGSSRLEAGHPYYDIARAVGSEIARVGFTTMTGGGPGLMEAVNRGAQESGGLSIGCPVSLPEQPYPNAYLDQYVSFDRFDLRKAMMVKHSYGFLVLPGGVGTLDELFEIMALISVAKLQDFPVALLPSAFWAPLIDFMRETLLRQGTILEHDLAYVALLDSPEAAVEHVRQATVDRFGLRLRPAPRRSPLPRE